MGGSDAEEAAIAGRRANGTAVSVPSAKSTSPPETAEAEPEEEPPVMRSGAAALRGAPKWAFLPLSEKASSSVISLPAKRAPALSSFATSGACAFLTPDMASMCGLPAEVG